MKANLSETTQYTFIIVPAVQDGGETLVISSSQAYQKHNWENKKK